MAFGILGLLLVVLVIVLVAVLVPKAIRRDEGTGERSRVGPIVIGGMLVLGVLVVFGFFTAVVSIAPGASFGRYFESPAAGEVAVSFTMQGSSEELEELSQLVSASFPLCLPEGVTAQYWHGGAGSHSGLFGPSSSYEHAYYHLETTTGDIDSIGDDPLDFDVLLEEASMVVRDRLAAEPLDELPAAIIGYRSPDGSVLRAARLVGEGDTVAFVEVSPDTIWGADGGGGGSEFRFAPGADFAAEPVHIIVDEPLLTPAEVREAVEDGDDTTTGESTGSGATNGG